jgi:HicB-like protein involved in pilus formation
MEAARGPQESPERRKRGGSHSGRLLLRMPEALHADLARASERAGVSLNAYINDVLSQAVGSRRQAAAGPSTPDETRRKSARRRFVERLLVINLVVVATVGALVIVLLVQAVR